MREPVYVDLEPLDTAAFAPYGQVMRRAGRDADLAGDLSQAWGMDLAADGPLPVTSAPSWCRGTAASSCGGARGMPCPVSPSVGAPAISS